MVKVRVLQMGDGGVSVVIPAPNSKRIDETTEEWETRVFAKANPEALPFNDVDDTALPSRRFRDEWKPHASGAEVDLPSAKARVKLECRGVRNAELVKTDGDMARENEQGNASSQAAMKAARQALRDLPATVDADIDAQATAADLEAAYPRELTLAEYQAK